MIRILCFWSTFLLLGSPLQAEHKWNPALLLQHPKPKGNFDGLVIPVKRAKNLADLFTTVNDAGEKIPDWQAVWLTPGIMAAVAAGFFATFFEETATGSAAKA